MTTKTTVTETKLRRLLAHYREAEALAQAARAVNPYSADTRKAFKLATRRWYALDRAEKSFFGGGPCFGDHGRYDSDVENFRKKYRAEVTHPECPFPTKGKDQQIWCDVCHKWTDAPLALEPK